MMHAGPAEKTGSIFVGILLVYCVISANTLGAFQRFLKYFSENIGSVGLLLK
jgi:hypothetical protein